MNQAGPRECNIIVLMDKIYLTFLQENHQTDNVAWEYADTRKINKIGA